MYMQKLHPPLIFCQNWIHNVKIIMFWDSILSVSIVLLDTENNSLGCISFVAKFNLSISFVLLW